jgi:transcriptional regulator with XRE-family HTH domain
MDMEKDLVEELLDEGTAEDPEFPQLVEAAERAHSLVRMLARAREQASITQAELARRMGTTQSAIARLEAAERDPHLSTVVRYAQIVGKLLLPLDTEVLGTAAPMASSFGAANAADVRSKPVHGGTKVGRARARKRVAAAKS